MSSQLWPEPDASPFDEVFASASIRTVDDDDLPSIPDPEVPDFAKGLDEPHRYKVLWGGRGAGRSWSVVRKLLVRAARQPLRILCARELQSSIKDSVHAVLKDQIKRLGLSAYQVTQQEIRYPNGSTFIFKGLRNDPEEIKSMEGIDICWVEEAHRVSDDSWKLLIPTIRKEGSEIWVTFNPDQETDPTYQRFIVNPPPDAFVRKATWQDNPWLTDVLRAEKDYLYAVDPDAAAHVWGGETRQATDAQILKGKWVVEEFEPITQEWLLERHGPKAMESEILRAMLWDGPYHGTDFGFAQDPTTLVKLWIDGRRLYVEREAYKIGLELDHTAEFFMAEVPGCQMHVIRADSARPESISYLSRHGLPRMESVKKWPGSVEDGIAHLRQYDQIVIHPRCVHTINEARHYSYKTDRRTGDVLPEIVDQHNHTIDPIRYALAPLIKPGAVPFAFSL